MGKLVLWALFDDGNCSYKKAIEKYFDGEFDVHCFGINEQPFENKRNYHYHRIDLSLTNFDLLKELTKISKKAYPNIILASPPCESWSGADCAGKMVKSFTKDRWIVKNREFYDDYNEGCKPVKRRFFVQKETSRIIGENTIGATIIIIEHFKPSVWVIENPATAKSWEYQEAHWCFKGIMNKTFYSSYDSSFSTKPTIFKSNMDLHLSKNRIKGNNSHMAKGSYDKRSAIPDKLIQKILYVALKKFNNKKGKRK